MANTMNGEISFLHGGQQMTAVFDMEAWLAIEDALGIGMFALHDMLERAKADPLLIKMATLATILQCGLQRHHPKVTRSEAATMLISSRDLLETLGVGLDSTLPQQGDPGVPHPPKPVTQKAAAPAAKRKPPAKKQRGAGPKR